MLSVGISRRLLFVSLLGVSHWASPEHILVCMRLPSFLPPSLKLGLSLLWLMLPLQHNVFVTASCWCGGQVHLNK